jgi:hypothetical protein
MLAPTTILRQNLTGQGMPTSNYCLGKEIVLTYWEDIFFNKQYSSVQVILSSNANCTFAGVIKVYEVIPSPTSPQTLSELGNVIFQTYYDKLSMNPTQSFCFGFCLAPTTTSTTTTSTTTTTTPCVYGNGIILIVTS